ncbi:hypothetical protein ACTD5D_40550 [Nocardia takedensis]|uniref:hypothetical protein n=1 Tax=Nocardia takedensis TaxID=259390 RepID=UPI003F770315
MRQAPRATRKAFAPDTGLPVDAIEKAVAGYRTVDRGERPEIRIRREFGCSANLHMGRFGR